MCMHYSAGKDCIHLHVLNGRTNPLTVKRTRYRSGNSNGFLYYEYRTDLKENAMSTVNAGTLAYSISHDTLASMNNINEIKYVFK